MAPYMAQYDVEASANGTADHKVGMLKNSIPAATIPDSKPTANGVAAPPAKAMPEPEDPPLKPEDPDWGLHEPATEIDAKDKGSPDDWVPRHPDLIRLTGRHPLNCEPPPTTLLDRGYITPSSLHYVRNHGAVPKLKWGTHRVVVNGLVNKPTSFTMDQLAALPTVTVTATLTCAGNRRKEENMVKQTIGFSWGPAGTACGRWTGVRLLDVLKACGVKTPAEGANYVCFRGPKGELPKGADGSYATSVTWHKAMDPAGDVILAYKHNGRLLTPDHGFPIRIIIPGYIGGRMVKWLEEITVTPTESDNHYHYNDNRVLPSHVTEELAIAEGWWYKPDFIINDLNINSAILAPAHNEQVSLSSRDTYTVRGYAYCGGGRKIIRCEVSLDNGESWRLAEQYTEDPNEYGKYYAWMLWSLDVPMVDLLQTREIICRAWDDSMNTQPNSFTWNLMGMMNNCVYRVKIAAVKAGSSGDLALQFEHPTIAGPTVGGWMNRETEQPAAPVPAPVPAADAKALANRVARRTFTMSEVEKHDSKKDGWFVRDGKVYDATPFMEEHPGGAESIVLVAGTDASEEFNAIHSSKAIAMLDQYYIGDLVSEAAAPAGPAAETSAAVELVALDPKKKVRVQLAERQELTHNTRRYRFALPTPQHRLGLPTGMHVFLYAKVKGVTVMRAYTPTSPDTTLGFFDLVVKVYWAGQHDDYPDGGKMSQHLESMAIGDEIEIKGPLGHFTYLGGGRCRIGERQQEVTHVSLIAGGTGITPCFQVIQAVLSDPHDMTQLSLVFCNCTPEDILLREQLDAMAADSRLRIFHTVNSTSAPESWPHGTGRISEAMLRERLFPASPGTICGICGPPGMIKEACLPNLEKMGYTKEQIVIF